MHRARAGLLTCLAVALLAAPAAAAPTTTVQRTIQDCDGDNLLEHAAGEDHVLFGSPFGDEGCEEQGGGEELRLGPDDSVINFIQLSDFQMVDEESPARVEFLDGTQRFPGLQPFSAAYRPQESLTTQVTEAMVRQVRNARSPVTSAAPELSILTGDNADSQQYNETRWFIDILDGTTGAENPDPEMETPGEGPGRDRKIDPDSGIPGADPVVPGRTCEATPGSVYDGVRDDGQAGVPDDGYYEPDSSAPPRDDGDGYSPDPARNEAETGRPVTVRDFPELFESANEPFEALGLDMPWYTAFGNHDALVQGNSPQAYIGPLGPSGEFAEPASHGLATGCAKVMQPAPAAQAELARLTALAEAAPTAAQRDAAIGTALEFANGLLEDPGAGTVEIVPPDPRRCYVAKDDNALALDAGLAPGPCRTGSWIKQHFRTSGTPVGHGLAPTRAADCAKYGDERADCEQASEGLAQQGLGRPPEAVENHDGYYSFVPKPGLRFVVLDTITDECGSLFCSEGSVDDTQFAWLRQQIAQAEELGQYVLVFSHHTLRTTRFPTADGTEEPQHDGERFDRKGGRPVGVSPEETLEELYCRNENVLGHIAGHEHENYVERHDCADDDPPPPRCVEPGVTCPNPHFWQISTAAHIDYPQQARMIELVDVDGEMSFVLTILDHDGPPDPGAGGGTPSVLKLGAIAREIAYNDYQGSRAARGGRQDRNVILPTDRPPPPATP